MKPQDLVILLKIIAMGERQWYHHTLAEELGISQSEITESLNRSKYSRLIDADRKKINILSLLDFIEYGLKYVFPQRPGEIVRGIPTSHSAPPLNHEIISDESYVWPYSRGELRGQAIIPLYKSVPFAVRNDKVLHELLALIDAVRVGRARERDLALVKLKERLNNA